MPRKNTDQDLKEVGLSHRGWRISFSSAAAIVFDQSNIKIKTKILTILNNLSRNKEGFDLEDRDIYIKAFVYTLKTVRMTLLFDRDENASGDIVVISIDKVDNSKSKNKEIHQKYSKQQIESNKYNANLIDEKPELSLYSVRAAIVTKLADQLQAMVEESGNPVNFNTLAWISRWLSEPLPALHGARPRDFLDTIEGQALVSRTLAQIQSGAYA